MVSDKDVVKSLLVDLEDQAFIDTITESLSQRQHLAFAVVKFACPTLTFPPLTAISENRYSGTLKSFVTTSYYGFISCPDLETTFACDVWLHGSQYSGQEVGTALTFAVFLNNDGKPQAFDVLSAKDRGASGNSKGGGKAPNPRQGKEGKAAWGAKAVGCWQQPVHVSTKGSPAQVFQGVTSAGLWLAVYVGGKTKPALQVRGKGSPTLQFGGKGWPTAQVSSKGMFGTAAQGSLKRLRTERW